jgi:hypothetical protein
VSALNAMGYFSLMKATLLVESSKRCNSQQFPLILNEPGSVLSQPQRDVLTTKR